MKIFISHSSQDKWIARRISADLEGFGVTTFLDEKDIETGESIDASIQTHLSDCDEVLMLLSPAALGSDWVLIEIGGGKALRKRLIPVLLHVGPNDLPEALGDGLARDLNDIDKYYEEVKRRLTAQPTSKARSRKDPVRAKSEVQRAALKRTIDARAISKQRRTFAEGDLAKIPENRQRDFRANSGAVITWNDEMDQHVGKIGFVTAVDESERMVKLDADSRWWWAMDWLDPVVPPEFGKG